MLTIPSRKAAKRATDAGVQVALARAAFELFTSRFPCGLMVQETARLGVRFCTI